MAGGTTPRHVADRYRGLIDALVIDSSDALADPLADTGVPCVVTATLMTDLAAARRLAEATLEAVT